MHPTPQPPRRRLVLVTLLALVSLGVLALTHPALGPAVWSRGDDLALAVAWLVAVVAAAWLFLATGTCVVALGLGRPRIARRLAPALPFGVRRLVEVAVVAACVSLPALPAHAVGPAPVAPAGVVIDQPVVRGRIATAPVVRTAPAPVPPVAPPAAPVSAARDVIVRSGDNLWSIARNALTHDSARRPNDTEVARYWHAVIAANRSTLRSRDASLIFPGEVVTLPPPPAVS